jgi:hypothetical protein
VTAAFQASPAEAQSREGAVFRSSHTLVGRYPRRNRTSRDCGHETVDTCRAAKNAWRGTKATGLYLGRNPRLAA